MCWLVGNWVADHQRILVGDRVFFLGNFGAVLIVYAAVLMQISLTNHFGLSTTLAGVMPDSEV